MNDLDRIEQQLIEARDALIAYWEQPEGQACLLALRVAEEALSDVRALDSPTVRSRDAESWRRIEMVADEIVRLRAPLEGAL